jgi:hypothetical protein
MGRILVLAYLFCVLAPSLAFAFGDSHKTAPCLMDEDHALGVVHVHQADPGTVRHHADGATHQHIAKIASAVPAHQDGANPPPCCGMVSISGIPAVLPCFAVPVRRALLHAPENYDALAGQSPARHYRPPIA